MKRFIIFAIFSAFIISCQTPTGSDSTPVPAARSVAIQTTDGVRYVKNSLWQGCSLEYLTAKSATRAADATISAEDLTEIVQALNNAEDDNQYFISEEDITIEESPNCNIYIATNVGHDIKTEYLDFPRAELAQMLIYCKIDADALGACTVYVDKVPPYVPPAVDDRPDSIKHLIYVIDSTDGSIYWQEVSNDTIPTDYTKSQDEWFKERVAMLRDWAISLGYARYYVWSGSEYTPPTTDPAE